MDSDRQSSRLRLFLYCALCGLDSSTVLTIIQYSVLSKCVYKLSLLTNHCAVYLVFEYLFS